MVDASTNTLTPQGDSADEPSSRRAAKKERTRRLLLSAAAEVIAERGFHDASLMEIASRAGLTTGAIYSNFRSKEDVFLAVIRDVSVPLDLGPGLSTISERLVTAAVEGARGVDLPESRRLLKLQLEFALLTIQDPALLEEFVSDVRTGREELARLIAEDGEAPLPDFRPSPKQLATAIIATMQGLQQHRFLDREAVPEELAGWAVQALLHVASKARESVGAS
jgi:AcrR family transcriptional regulator